ncbi:MAG: hypothetical protein C0604_06215 [Clostridiales bacterium]|nr:MAG: hypothetical protein C0604_06215 [Clostridiales bacterium]
MENKNIIRGGSFMKFKKNISLFLICMLTLSLFAGCTANNQEAAEPAEAPAASEETKIDSMEYVSGGATGSWIKIAAGIAEKANGYFEGFPISATPGGSVQNPAVVAMGDAEIGMSYAPFFVMAENGEGPYEKPSTNLRAVASLTPTVLHFFAKNEIEADSVSELIEKEIPVTIGMPPNGAGSNYIASIIFSELGYDKIEGIEEYGSKIFYGDGGTLTDAWKDGHVDVDIMTYNVPSAPIQESLTARDGKLLNIDGDLAEVLINEKGFEKYVIPAGTYPGQDEDVVTVSLKIVVFVREDVPEDVVYNLTKAIYENKSYYVGVHSSFEDFYPENMINGLAIGMHEGAAKFYKEVGLVK